MQSLYKPSIIRKNATKNMLKTPKISFSLEWVFIENCWRLLSLYLCDKTTEANSSHLIIQHRVSDILVALRLTQSSSKLESSVTVQGCISAGMHGAVLARLQIHSCASDAPQTSELQTKRRRSFENL